MVLIRTSPKGNTVTHGEMLFFDIWYNALCRPRGLCKTICQTRLLRYILALCAFYASMFITIFPNLHDTLNDMTIPCLLWIQPLWKSWTSDDEWKLYYSAATMNFANVDIFAFTVCPVGTRLYIITCFSVKFNINYINMISI